MTEPKRPRTVLVTGAGGNLGRKIVAHLATKDWCNTIIGIDRGGIDETKALSGKVEVVTADLRDPYDNGWIEAVGRADAIVHFAAQNPYPPCSWEDAIASIDMTANLLQRTNPRGCRFAFASSNHVMGGYKDEDWEAVRPLKSTTPPRPGTRFFAGGGYAQPNMYATTKLVGERLLKAKAAGAAGTFTAVALRIGWCLSGDGDPHRIAAAGGSVVAGPVAMQPPAEEAHDLKWFRNMWLSNRDLCAEFEAALTADASAWPEPAIVVNAISVNRGTIWDMTEAKAWLGHEPQDDVWTELGMEPD